MITAFFFKERKDTPSAAFLRIIYSVHYLHASGDYVFGGEWHVKVLPDPRDELRNDQLLCEIAASAAERMVKAFNWWIGLGIRRDLCL